MNKRRFLAVLLCYLCVMSGCAERSVGGVRLTGIEISRHESSYRIEAELDTLDQSAISQGVRDALAQEWLEYHELTEEERMYSSRAWGSCTMDFSSWSECERFTGVSVYNPLDGAEWLENTHIRAEWYGTQSGEISMLRKEAEYLYGDIRVTLSAHFNCTEGPVFSTGCAWSSVMRFRSEARTLGSGGRALTVMPQNVGNYTTVTAYFVIENVLYSLDVTGSQESKTEINEELDKALREF